MKQINLIIIFSIAGFLFSGYLSITELLLGACPLTEGCPVVWGLPSCVYGFMLFTALLMISLITALKNIDLMKYVSLVSAGGILFAIYSIIIEVFLTPCPVIGCVYSLGIPACVYGLAMYIIIFVLSVIKLK